MLWSYYSTAHELNDKPLPSSGPAVSALTPATIDDMMEKAWKEHDLKVAEPATPGEFARRAYLDFYGRVPTRDELKTFLKNPDRNALCDALSKNRQGSENLAYLLATDLKPETPAEDGREELHASLEDFLFERMQKKEPWKDVVKRLIDPGVRDGSGSFLRNLRGQEPEETADPRFYQYDMHPATGVIAGKFLGSQVQCAQCHAHPFAEWSQADYWGVNSALRTMNFFVSRRNDPRDVEYDAPKGRVGKASPRYFDGTQLDRGEIDSLEQLAGKVSGDRRLNITLANRLWTFLFGAGLNTPSAPDDLFSGPKGELNVGSHTALLKRLAEYLEQTSDPKAFLGLLCKTKAYGLSSENVAGQDTEQAENLFAKSALRKLSLRQVVRSILAIGSPERAYQNSIDDLLAEALFKGGFRNSPNVPVEAVYGTHEMLTLLNNPVVAQRLSNNASQNIDEVYESVLGRSPTAEEKTKAAKLLSAPPHPEREILRMFEPEANRVLQGPNFDTTSEEAWTSFKKELPKAIEEAQRAKDPEKLDQWFARYKKVDLFRGVPSLKRYLSDPGLRDLMTTLIASHEFNYNH